MMRKNSRVSLRGGDWSEEADMLIIGGTAGGISLAMAACRAGLTVRLVASRPYLGEDICGDMRLWPEAGNDGDLAGKIFGPEGHPVTPMAVKLGLEQSLVEAGIPFLLGVYPAQPLMDAEGTVRGCRMASRSGYLDFYARLVIDATTEGTLARMTGWQPMDEPVGLKRVVHVTLCNGEGRDAPGVDRVKRLPGFEGQIGETSYSLSARRYELEVDFGSGSPADRARAEAEIVDRCWVPEEYLHQERIRLLEAEPEAVDPRGPEDLAVHEGLGLLVPEAYGDPRERRALQSPRAALESGASLMEAVKALLETRPGRELSALADPGEPPLLDRCDVLVLGGGTGGAPAAIAASRQGARVIVVEAGDQLGGVGTLGQISRYWFGNRVGFTAEIDREVSALETDATLRKNPGQWSPAAKSRWFENQCFAGGVIVFTRSLCSGVMVEGRAVTGLEVATPYGYGRIEAKCVVDATGCADVAAAAGGPVVEPGTDNLALQGTGLAAFEPGKVYHNTDHNFCDDTDVIDTTSFLVSTKVKYRDHFDAGQLVDSRERRQIVGELVLGPADFLAERRYPDTVCVASSNFDSHGYTIHPVFMCQPPHKKRLWADIPFRALLPKGLERVLTTGLGVSAHRDALPVIRMQADVQNQGYAAGCAAAMSARRNLDLRDLPLRELQAHLVEVGILPERCLDEADSFPLSREALEAAIRDELDSLKGLAILFSEPKRSLPLLKAAYGRASGEDGRRLALARILALMDCPDGLEAIRTAVEGEDWDAGWNFRGMGQFGMSLSGMDVLLIALGRIGTGEDWDRILGKIESLPDNADFSHCRAVVKASEALYAHHPDDRAAPALERLRQRCPQGWVQTTLSRVQEALTDDPNETEVRNRALREFHLARGIYRCGDPDGTGRSILEAYAGDLRGLFARHARKVLAEGDQDPAREAFSIEATG
jgi:hypothetical protein